MEVMVNPKKQSTNGTWPTPRLHKNDWGEWEIHPDDPDAGLRWWEAVIAYVAGVGAVVFTSLWTWAVFRGIRGLVRMVLK